MIKKLAIAATVLLTGCQTFESMDAGLSTLNGKPYQAAFNVLGFPDAESSIAGKKVFTWSTSNAGSYSVPTYNTNTAYVNGTPVFIQSQGSQTVNYDYNCRIDVIVGSSGIIEGSKFDGNIGGCEQWGRKLGTLVPKQKKAV